MRGSELKNLSAQRHLGGGGQWSGRRMAAKIDGLLQGREKDLAPWTGAEMLANLAADVARQLVVEIIGQPPENLQAVGLRVPVLSP